jgi:valyl-tRNA synthetase
MEFGTGALKVTPAHDINDYALGTKHQLEIIDVLTPEGKMSEAAGFYIGEDRFVVRKKIVKDLEASGHLVKTEPYKSNVGFSERTNAVIEPRLSMQWFLKMSEISKPALENVMNDNIRLVPEKFKNTYRHWMENVHDWCISRQLWWGQRIPAWYNDKGDFVVAKTIAEAKVQFEKESKATTGLKQDEDVLDTWFSSWLWPISVFDGFKDPNNADINYYYPTNDLVTAPEILFFWVARMIIAGYEYRNDKPFSNVYLTGIVRDKQGRKMSKSLGNSPEPLELITKYGADGVRVGMLLCSPAGNDLPFDESLCEQGRNFSNKVWNAFRLIHSWKISDESKETDARDHSQTITWFHNRLAVELENINDLYSKYRISETLMAIYKLVWDDFCSWYLEIVKPGLGQEMNQQTYDSTIQYFESLLKILHPFMPFITEEIWHLINERKENDCIIVSSWPVYEINNKTILIDFENVQHLVTQVRNIRKSKNIPNKEPLQLWYSDTINTSLHSLHSVVSKLCNISEIQFVNEKPQNMVAILAGNSEYFIDIRGLINNEEERKKITVEIDYLKGFLNSVNKKLSNERFIAGAKPEVIAIENKKKLDAEEKIKLLENQLAVMN